MSRGPGECSLVPSGLRSTPDRGPCVRAARPRSGGGPSLGVGRSGGRPRSGGPRSEGRPRSGGGRSGAVEPGLGGGPGLGGSPGLGGGGQVLGVQVWGGGTRSGEGAQVWGGRSPEAKEGEA